MLNADDAVEAKYFQMLSVAAALLLDLDLDVPGAFTLWHASISDINSDTDVYGQPPPWHPPAMGVETSGEGIYILRCLPTRGRLIS